MEWALEWAFVVIHIAIHLIITGCFELLPIRSKSKHIAHLMSAHAKATKRRMRAAKNYEATRNNAEAILLGIELGREMAYEEMLSSILPKRKLNRNSPLIKL